MNCTQSITKEEILADRLLQSATQSLEIFSIYLGHRLGLYTALRDCGPLNAPTLARVTGIGPRHAAEWLEQQAVAGFIGTEDTQAGRDERIYWLPDAHAHVLCEVGHPAYLTPLSQMVAGIASALPEVTAAYRAGRGVPYSWYGADFRQGQGAINQSAFLHDLPYQWLPSIEDVHARLSSAPPARVADLGCGLGWSAIGVADAYPQAEVIGFDTDEASIAEASRIAAGRGSRAQFECRDAAQLRERGPFDLVLLLEALHDMSHPTEVLRAVRGSLARGGSVLIADERVAESFQAPGDDLERLMYGWSLVHCLPVSLNQHGSEAIGTAIRPCTVESIAHRAGFGQFEVLSFSSQFFRFFRLRP